MLASGQPSNARAMMYRLLEQPFIFPDPERTQAFISGRWQDDLRRCSERLGFDLQAENELKLPHGTKAYETEFISLFEVGMGGAPCPLHSGHYARDRMVTMEETLRFYRHFDFHPDRSADRFPDHINFELQFMAVLADACEDAQSTQGDFLSPLLAQRDFARRNLASWLPELKQLIDKNASINFFKQAGHLLSNFVAWDTSMLEARAHELEPA